MYVAGCAPEQVGLARAVGHQSPGAHVLAQLIHCRQPVLRHEVHDPCDTDLVDRFGGHRERIGALLHHCCECGLELDARTHAYRHDRHTQRRCRSLYLFELEDIGGVVRIPEKGYARDGWNNLLENLQPLGTDVRANDGVAGDISSRSGEAWHEPGAYGIADRDHDDGDRGGGLVSREACGRAEGRNDVHRATNERRRGLGESLRHSIAIRIVEGDVLAFEVTEIAQPVTEGVPVERVVDNADARDLPRLLRARRERPRSRRAADKRNEVAALHSITSSTMESTACGTSMFSARAVCKFMTSSNLVDCSTGNSAGFSPLRILPA